jgi:ATP-dependent DNA helicase PIF1
MARTARSLSRLSTTATIGRGKRKSTDDAEETKGTRPVKQARMSLDAYFSPQVLVSGSPGAKEENCERKHVTLNEQQIAVLKMVVEEEKNVFFTGAAGESLTTWLKGVGDMGNSHPWLFIGTGKSLLLRAIIGALRKKYTNKPECVSVTASTGMAASNIGGKLRSGSVLSTT